MSRTRGLHQREPLIQNAADASPVQATALRCGQLTLHSVTPEWILDVPHRRLVHVVTVNAEVFVYGHEDPALRAILSSTLNTIDGRVLQGICKCLYTRARINRVAGADFIYRLSEHCRRCREKLFLLGSTEKANSTAIQILQQRFPGLQISGLAPSFSPYPFPPAWNARMLQEIEQFRPRHLVVCFGPRKQEYWIHEHSARLEEMEVGFAYGLGGTIDFVAGTRPRAPRWIQFSGAEWLFRFITEPRARFRRTLRMFKMPFYAACTVRKIGAVE